MLRSYRDPTNLPLERGKKRKETTKIEAQTWRCLLLTTWMVDAVVSRRQKHKPRYSQVREMMNQFANLISNPPQLISSWHMKKTGHPMLYLSRDQSCLSISSEGKYTERSSHWLLHSFCERLTKYLGMDSREPVAETMHVSCDAMSRLIIQILTKMHTLLGSTVVFLSALAPLGERHSTAEWVHPDLCQTCWLRAVWFFIMVLEIWVVQYLS